MAILAIIEGRVKTERLSAAIDHWLPFIYGETLQLDNDRVLRDPS